MNIPALIFSKVVSSSNLTQVFFCVANKNLPQFNVTNTSPTEFANKNNLVRHDKFDWQVNKLKPMCYFFEYNSKENEALPSHLLLCENPSAPLQWFLFPHARKEIDNGTQRNLLQLGVQYISYGMVDDSVIAAEYDEAWLKEVEKLIVK